MKPVRLIGQVLLASAALLATGAFAGPPKGDKTVRTAHDDPEMEAARKKAHATLDTFLATAARPPADSVDFKLKVAVKDGVNTEHFWVIPFQVTAQGFEGTLSNEPDLVHNVKMGQLIKFQRKDISDWGYTKAGRQVGSFTVCALFKRMPAEDVKYYRENHGFDC
jgi:uncharacterized protein YegJ (DUF2314 family)